MIWDLRRVPVQRQQLLDEDLQQQKELYKLSRRKEDHPKAYELRERRWLRVTYFGEVGLGGSERGSEGAD